MSDISRFNGHASQESQRDVRTIVEEIKRKRNPPDEIHIEATETPKAKRRTPVKRKGSGRDQPDAKAFALWYETYEAKGGFTQIENAIWDFPGGISIEATGMYGYLSRYGFDRDKVWTGVDRIADHFHLSRTTVIKYLDELVGWGLVERKRVGHRKPNVYTLVHRMPREKSTV